MWRGQSANSERTTMHVEAIYRFQAFVYSEWTASIDALIITRTGSTDAFVPIQSLLFPMLLFAIDGFDAGCIDNDPPLREEKDDQWLLFFVFFFFLERLAIVNLLVWIGSWGYVCLRLSQLRNFKELKSKVRKLLSKVVVFEKKLKFTFSIFNNRFDRMIQDLFLFE